jgi:hypothetical protein
MKSIEIEKIKIKKIGGGIDITNYFHYDFEVVIS